ncbi:MAG: hypothetical protein R3C53_17115 [Pirellulaceae bacterium]
MSKQQFREIRELVTVPCATINSAIIKSRLGCICRWLASLCVALSVSTIRAEQPPTAFPAAATPPSSLYGQLIERGIQLPSDLLVTVDPAIAPDDFLAMGSEERRQQLETVAGKNGWDRFSRDSAVAPVRIELEFIKNSAGERVGHRIYSVFVAYAPLETLRDEQLMREIFGQASVDSGDERPDSSLTADNPDATTTPASRNVPLAELKRLGISPPSEQERFAAIELPLLNRVTMRGTIQVQRNEGPGWVRLVWQIDPRFADSTDFGNTWTKFERNEVGMPIETEPKPYAGCGGYLQIIQIDAELQQLLVESRMVMYEPVDWFSGSNFLRSKLPTVLQENARSFRRGLTREHTEK